jgi:hypothetical protein
LASGFALLVGWIAHASRRTIDSREAIPLALSTKDIP